MSDLIKVAAIGMVAAICAMVVRKYMPELAILLSTSAGVLILLYCSGTLSSVRAFMDELVEVGGVTPEIIEPVAKVTGVAIITRLAADFCKDAKESALASVVEMAGSVLGLFMILPLMSAVLELLGSLL